MLTFLEGWDMLYERPLYLQQWVHLAQRKWFGVTDGDCHISAEEFDKLMGHAVAVVDVAASCFAAELIEAYPDAKVILNHRVDLDAWHRSAVKNIKGVVYDSWPLWFMTWFNTELWWMWHAAERYLWPRLFQSRGDNLDGITDNGKWIYRAHNNMIRGLVPKERLLEWHIEQGWEPICEFLGKKVPSEPFPRTNDAAGFEKHKDELLAQCAKGAFTNMAITGAVLVTVIAGAWKMSR